MPKSERGFTLIELLVAISIVAILALIGLAVFQNIRTKALDGKIKSDLNAIKKAYETNYDSTGQGSYKALTSNMFASGAIPVQPNGSSYPCSIGPDSTCNVVNNQGYQVSAILSDNTNFAVVSNQGTLSNTVNLSSVCSASLTSGLQAYWKFNEGTGTTAADSSGNNHTASLINNPAWDIGVIDRSISFNGSNQYGSFPLNLEISGQTAVKNPSSLSFWIYPKQDLKSSSQGILSSDSADGCGNLTIDSATLNQLSFGQTCYGHPYIDITSDNNYWINKWVHIVVTFDGASEKVFVNGAQRTLLATASQNINWVVTTLGKRYVTLASPATTLFNGLVDEVRIYDRALSASEVSLLYNGGIACQ